MSSSRLKNELADHIYQYLCHEAQYSDLPEAARESLTAASECIEQAYKLNINNAKQSILPDELFRMFTRHKEFLSQQKDSINYSLRNENESSSIEKPDIRVNSNPLATNSNPVSSNTNSPNTNTTSSVQVSSSISNQPSQQQLQQQQTTKQHSQHPISQLPMTTRKKLSHLRAQIKRQASKAARSRLEKRSSVSGVTANSGGSFGGSIHLGGMLGTSLDGNNGTNSKAGESYNVKDSSNQPNSSSSDLPNTYLINPSFSLPAGPGGVCSSSGGGGGSGAGGGGGGGGGGGNVGDSGQIESNINSSVSSNQQNESGVSTSGAKQSSHLIPGSHHHHSSSIGVSVHQKNFKQKLIALIKKFRTDGSDFDSEEQYREALERELMKAAAGRGSRAIEELLEEDIDVEGESGSEPEDWDNISESSTPKPSLRPFFSSTTLDKI